jgi:hypothetical protein
VVCFDVLRGAVQFLDKLLSALQCCGQLRIPGQGEKDSGMNMKSVPG